MCDCLTWALLDDSRFRACEIDTPRLELVGVFGGGGTEVRRSSNPYVLIVAMPSVVMLL